MSQSVIEQDIKQVELSIEEAKKAVKFGEAIDRLSRNRDFREVIHNQYFVEEAARLVHLAHDMRIPEEVRKACFTDMAGPAALKRFLQAGKAFGDTAAAELESHMETLEELQAEAGEED